jgi:hypothetical protein
LFDPDNYDPNDPVKISFLCGTEFEEWVDEKILALEDYDEGYYVQRIDTMRGTLYQLQTTARHIEHDDFKRFLFQIKLKFGEEAKVR